MHSWHSGWLPRGSHSSRPQRGSELAENHHILWVKVITEPTLRGVEKQTPSLHGMVARSPGRIAREMGDTATAMVLNTLPWQGSGSFGFLHCICLHSSKLCTRSMHYFYSQEKKGSSLEIMAHDQQATISARSVFSSWAFLWHNPPTPIAHFLSVWALFLGDQSGKGQERSGHIIEPHLKCWAFWLSGIPGC